MAKPIKNYHIDSCSYSWFEVSAINQTRFIADITDIEGVESVTNYGNYLAVWCSPLYSKQDLIDEVVALLDSAFAPIAESFADVFDEPES